MAQTFTRVSQQAARYTLMGGVERCGRCRFFLKNNLCARVVGDVSPSAWCKFFSMAATMRTDAGGGAAATHAGSGGPPGVALDLSFMTPGTLDPRITFTRASIGTYFDVAGILQTATANTPRWGYDPVTHALRGLLIEEQRINVLLNSATLGTQSVAVTAQAYTLSFYDTGTVTLSGVSTAGPLVGTGAFPTRVALTFTPTAGTLTLTVTGSVLNAQLEAGAFATSAIPTTAAAVTRSADAASMPTSTWFNTTVSSLCGEFMVAQSPNSSVLNRDVCCISDGSTTNRLALRGLVASSASALIFASIAGTTTTSTTLGNTPANAVSKMAGAWNGTTGVGALNGGAPVSYAVGMPGSLSTLVIGNDNIASGLWINGWVQRVRYWPRALTNAELQQVTT